MSKKRKHAAALTAPATVPATAPAGAQLVLVTTGDRRDTRCQQWWFHLSCCNKGQHSVAGSSLLVPAGELLATPHIANPSLGIDRQVPRLLTVQVGMSAEGEEYGLPLSTQLRGDQQGVQVPGPEDDEWGYGASCRWRWSCSLGSKAFALGHRSVMEVPAWSGGPG